MNILRHSGKDYAWNNGHTYNRIDWALVNGKQILDIPMLEVIVMDLEYSNHSPLSIILVKEKTQRPKSFRFLNDLTKYEKFHEAVAAAWG